MVSCSFKEVKDLDMTMVSNNTINGKYIDWVFFDIGNVLFYDLPLLARIWRHFYLTLSQAGLKQSYSEVIAERENILRNHPPEDNPRRLIAQSFASHIPEEARRRATDQWLHLYPGANLLVPGSVEVIETLKPDYRLGIIANQPELALAELEKFGLKDKFEAIIISDVVGYHKPDIRIFEEALRQAGANPSRSVMVGDRIDNDVRPAKRLGFRTVWLDMDFRKMDYAPPDEYERLYIESYLRITGVDQGIKAESDRPDAVIRELGELPGALNSINIGRTEMAEVMA